MNDPNRNVRDWTEEDERKYREMLETPVKRLTEREMLELAAVSPHPPLGAGNVSRKMNENEKTSIKSKNMRIEQEIYLKEEGFSPEKCIAELESPVSSKFVSVKINGERHDYYNLRKTPLKEIVYITLLREKPEKVLNELKEIVKGLEKSPEPQQKDNNDNFAKEITEAGIKAAKATHEFNMMEIKARLIADLCKELVKMPIRHEDVPQRAREIADKALQNL